MTAPSDTPLPRLDDSRLDRVRQRLRDHVPDLRKRNDERSTARRIVTAVADAALGVLAYIVLSIWIDIGVDVLGVFLAALTVFTVRDVWRHRR